jgi:hypothetical protein
MINQAKTVEEMQQVDRHLLLMAVIRLGVWLLFGCFLIVFVLYLFLTYRNGQPPSLQDIGTLFSSLVQLLVAAVTPPGI